MSTQSKWKEEQILVICPGSSSTLAQLGCSELTPPTQRFRTRMFQDQETGKWRPYYTYKRKKKLVLPSHAPAATNGDAAGGSAQQVGENGDKIPEEDDFEYVEDPDSDEGAVYPMQGGRIVNMEAFLAFLDHVHSMLTTTYHNTPIMLMASPQWTRPDCEDITRYIFEKTKTPALCLIHSGVATQYGLKWANLTVVDIGFEKVDVTCIYDSRVVSHRDLGPLGPEDRESISGGEVFTQKLLGLLKDKNFTYDMAEQLKKSHVCEVLPYAPELPQLMELPQETATAFQPAAAAVAPAAAASATTVGGPKVVEPTDLDDDGEEKMAEEEGVLDIASIVTSGQTKEFLAKKEKEKAERAKAAKARKGQEAADAANKPARLPNSKRLKTIFHYEEVVQEEPKALPQKENGASKDAEVKEPVKEAPTADPAAAAPADGSAPSATGDAPKPETTTTGEAEKPESTDPFKIDNFLPPPDAAPALPQTKRIRRDVEIGLERFTFAERAQIDRIATTIYRAVQEIDDMYMRPACWENIVFVGNGCRLRGLKDNILQTLTARHLISPSSATMFTSELPSNVATPSGTGAQTPTGSFTGPPHALPISSSVNPLLQAATTASLAVPPSGSGAPGSSAGDGSAPHSHHFHSQTPTSIKLAPLPTYLSEWTKNGFEESMFLGAQVAARLTFCIHNLDAQGLEAQRLMSLNRVDYNEMGPKGIRTHSMFP